MYRGYLQLGQTELANSRRTINYARNGVRNLTAEVVTDDSWPGMRHYLGVEDEWVLPELDWDCPWHDPSIPASADFAGVWPMQVEGLDATPLDRETIEGAVVGGSFGVLRTPPRVITVEALLVARSPAGLQYGKEWLTSALLADRDGETGQPRSLTFLASMPPWDDRWTQDEVERLALSETRMVADVVQTGPLEIEEEFGVWGWYGKGATSARVSFELTAGVPWIWRASTMLVDGLKPVEGRDLTIQFDPAGKAGLDEWIGKKPTELIDPNASPVVEVPRPVTPNAAPGMVPMESRRLMWVLEAGRLPRWADTVPSVTIRAGDKAERHVRVQWVEGVVEDTVDIARRTVGEALIGYLPPLSEFKLDAITGRAEVLTEDGLRLDGTTVTTGRLGGPWRPPVLNGSGAYTLVVDTLRDVSEDLTVQVDAHVRQA